MGVMDRFRLDGKAVVVTGGAGMLGSGFCRAVAEAGGTAVVADIDEEAAERTASEISGEAGGKALHFGVDITSRQSVESLGSWLAENTSGVYGLVNNAARDPKMGGSGPSPALQRFENMEAKAWDLDLDVGLKGAFICSQVLGAMMAEAGQGVILNVSSDLGVVAPDQRLYRKEGLPDDQQPVKPVTYSVLKHGLIGLTKYLATYWADKGVRSNAICPAGVYAGQSDEFVKRIAALIPMGRMAQRDEYEAAVPFLLSEASAYMNGSVLVMDGGRSTW